jgi:hypothetical protein
MDRSSTGNRASDTETVRYLTKFDLLHANGKHSLRQCARCSPLLLSILSQHFARLYGFRIAISIIHTGRDE